MAVWKIEIIGLLAAILTTFSFVPQALKMTKTKNASSISLSMYLVMVSGVILWLLYGILLERIAIILANSVSMVLQIWIIIMKLKHR